jgi:predicted AAA+ superfamily ATPase
MVFKTRLVGQDLIFQSIRESFPDIPHLFITGPCGCGKTTFIEDVIQLLKQEAPFKLESILWLSSEKDRGIHTIRDKVNDYCKKAHSQPNTLRWIIIDDADSLPLISQQALRRPMETFSHLTRFIFASRYPSHLIEPLRSRCHCIELEPIPPAIILPTIMESISSEKNTSTDTKGIPPKLYDFCIRNFSFIHEIKIIVNLYFAYLKQGGSEEESLSKLQSLLPISKPFTESLIRGFATRNESLIRKSITKLFLNGFLLDDILLSIENSIRIFPSTDPSVRFLILHFTMLGWISIQQGKEHWLDTLDIVDEVLKTS